MYKIMTPGPTQVAENVRLARSRECTNPDLDESFVEFYKETCEEISRLLHTDNETLILGGEGILGLEAACASMTEPGDRVLVLDNGIYGKGFADFVFIPRANAGFRPAMVVELKYNKSADTAIKQIKDNRYHGALSGYSDKILLVGISYDAEGKDKKHHTCVIEEINGSAADTQ